MKQRARRNVRGPNSAIFESAYLRTICKTNVLPVRVISSLNDRASWYATGLSNGTKYGRFPVAASGTDRSSHCLLYTSDAADE